MRSEHRAIAVAIAVAMLCLPFMGTSRGSDPVEPTQAPILMVGALGLMATRNILTPIAWQDPYTMAVLARVYDTPVQRDPTTDAVVAGLAAGIDQDADGVLDPADLGAFGLPSGTLDLTVFYNFTGARFHDGTPVTAMDVLFSYHALALHPMASSHLLPLMDRSGGSGSNFTVDRWLWVLPADDGDGNPLTAALRFQLQSAYSIFPWAVLGIPILPRAVWEGTGGGRHADFGLAIYPEADARAGRGVPTNDVTYSPFDVAAVRLWTMTDADVIGSGHYRFVTWSTGVSAQLDANADYAFGHPRYDGILFRLYSTMQFLVMALQGGAIDFVLGYVHPDFLPGLQSDPDLRFVTAPELFPAMLWCNLRRVPFGYSPYPPLDPQTDDLGAPFRRALAHLLDKPTMVHTLLSDSGLIADSVVSPASTAWHNGTLPRYQYDLPMAAAILDNAGWIDTNGNGWREFPRIGDALIDVMMPSADFDAIAAMTGAMLVSAARQVGINLRSAPLAWRAVAGYMSAHDFDIALFANLGMLELDPWTLGRGDPDYLFDVLHSLNAAEGWNNGGVWDSGLDSVLAGSRSAPDAGSRGTLVRWAQGIVAGKQLVEPLWYRNNTYVYRQDVMTGVQLVGSTVFNYWTLQGEMGQGPVITLVSPPDGSVIRPGVTIDLRIEDTDLASAEYRVDGGTALSLPAPYDVPTASWPDGPHVLNVSARDALGHEAEASYGFRVDGTPPVVVGRAPEGAVPVLPTKVDVTFSEAVNRSSVEAAFSITSGAQTWHADNGTFTWSWDNRSFAFTPDEPFRSSSAYEVRLAGTLTDLAGNPMGSDVAWSFTVLAGADLLVIAVAVILVAVVAGLLLLLLLRRRKRKPSEPADLPPREDAKP